VAPPHFGRCPVQSELTAVTNAERRRRHRTAAPKVGGANRCSQRPLSAWKSVGTAEGACGRLSPTKRAARKMQFNIRRVYEADRLGIDCRTTPSGQGSSGASCRSSARSTRARTWSSGQVADRAALTSTSWSCSLRPSNLTRPPMTNDRRAEHQCVRNCATPLCALHAQALEQVGQSGRRFVTAYSRCAG
jgi:hypothetical protein